MFTALPICILLTTAVPAKLRLSVGTLMSMKGSGHVRIFEQVKRPLTKQDVDRLKLEVGDELKADKNSVLKVRQPNGVVQEIKPKDGWALLKYRLNPKERQAENALRTNTRGAVAKGPGGFEWPAKVRVSSAHFVIIDPTLPSPSKFEVWQGGQEIWSGTLTRKDGAFTSDELLSALSKAQRGTKLKLVVGERSEEFYLLYQEDEAALAEGFAKAARLANPLERALAELQLLNYAKQVGPAMFRLEELRRQTAQ